MKFPVLAKSRLGFSIALVGMLTLVGLEAGSNAFLLRGRLATACGILVLVGLLLWLLGQLLQSRRAAGKNGDEVEDHPLAFLKSLRYWGFIVAASAILIYAIPPRPTLLVAQPSSPIVKPVKPVEPPPLTNAPPPETNAPPAETNAPALETNARLAVVFPDLKLQGLVYNGENSTAVINGKTLRVGRHIGEVKLVAIAANTVTVELSGEQRVLLVGE